MLQLWNEFQLIVGDQATRPLVDESIGGKIHLSEQCKKTLKKISRRAVGANRVSADQVVRDSELKRERIADGSKSKTAKRRKEAGRKKNNEVVILRKDSPFKADKTTIRDYGQDVSIKESTSNELYVDTKSLHAVNNEGIVYTPSELSKKSSVATGTKYETASSYISDRVEYHSATITYQLDVSKPVRESKRSLDRDLATENVVGHVPDHSANMIKIGRSPSQEIYAKDKPPWQSNLKRKRGQPQSLDNSKSLDLSEASEVNENIFGVSLKKTPNSKSLDFSEASEVNENIFGVSLKKTPIRIEGQQMPTNNEGATFSTLGSTDSPWSVTLKKVEGGQGSSILSPQCGVTMQNTSPWNVKLKPVAVPKKHHEINSQPENKYQKIDLQITDRDADVAPDSNPSRRIQNKIEYSSAEDIGENGEGGNEEVNDRVLATLSQMTKAPTELFSLKPGDIVDLSNLPPEITSSKSKTHVLPITHNEECERKVIVIAGESILIAKKREDDISCNSANVIWYKHFHQITSFNMKTTSGATGVEITSIDSPPYSLFFEDPSLYMTLVQTFLNFKNGVEDDSLQYFARDNTKRNSGARQLESEVGTSSSKSTERKSVLVTFDENDWKIITKFRDMLRRGTPENAVRYRLDNNYTDISEKVRDAIFDASRRIETPNNDDSTKVESESSFQIPSVLDPEKSNGNTVTANTAAIGRIKDRDSSDVQKNEEIESVAIGIGGIAAAAAAAAAALKKKEKGADTSANPLGMGGIAAAIAAAALKNNLGNSRNLFEDNAPAISTKGQSLPAELNKNDKGIPLKDDPKFEKYFKMLKMQLPIGAVKQRMAMDGLDPNILDLDHNKSLESQQNLKKREAEQESGIPLKDDPKFEKYFKMLKMHMPIGAVKQRMAMDGLDPNILDLDHNKSLESQQKPKTKTVTTKPLEKNKRRHTRLHWTAIEDVKDTSLWAERSDIKIRFDESEINKCFQEEVGEKGKHRITENNKKKSDVKFIDIGRAQNGAIILAGMKRLTLKEIVAAIDHVDNNVGLSVDEVESINEYIPKAEEVKLLTEYRCQMGKTEDELKSELCEYEKFIFEMTKIKQQKEKAGALLFKLQFSQRKAELESNIALLSNACDELEKSDKFKDILKLVLEFGNRLNTAGQARKGKVSGITLESINKLSETKGLGDGKGTTVLEFIVKNILEQNEELGEFREDIPSVLNADKLIWSSVQTAFKEFEREIENQFAIKDCTSLEEFKSRENLAILKNKSKEELKNDESVLSILQRSMQAAEDKFNHLTSDYFGERGKKVPNEWFKNICKFSKDFYSAKGKISAQIARKIKATAKKKKKSLDVAVSVPRKQLFTTPKTSERVSLDPLQSIRNRNSNGITAKKVSETISNMVQTPNVSRCDLTSVFHRIFPETHAALGPAIKLPNSGKGALTNTVIAQVLENNTDTSAAMDLSSASNMWTPTISNEFPPGPEGTALPKPERGASINTTTPQNKLTQVIGDNLTSVDQPSISSILASTVPNDSLPGSENNEHTSNTVTEAIELVDDNLSCRGGDDDLSYSSLKGEDDDISFASHSSQRRSLAIIPDSITVTETEL